jgi:hypothetical protein
MADNTPHTDNYPLSLFQGQLWYVGKLGGPNHDEYGRIQTSTKGGRVQSVTYEPGAAVTASAGDGRAIKVVNLGPDANTQAPYNVVASKPLAANYNSNAAISLDVVSSAVHCMDVLVLVAGPSVGLPSSPGSVTMTSTNEWP